MKKSFLIIFLITASFACKNKIEETITTQEVLDENTENQSDEFALLKGQFVYYDGAAVLQTPNEIYGVFITDKLLELDKKVSAYKNEPTDMVQVEIKGKITNKKDDKILWEKKVEVIEIVNVTPLKENKEQVLN
jgi:hypothetical protein